MLTERQKDGKTDMQKTVYPLKLRFAGIYRRSSDETLREATKSWAATVWSHVYVTEEIGHPRKNT